jgi:hypothetical protein
MDLSNSKTTPSDILMKYYSKNARWRQYIFRYTYLQQVFPFRDTLIRYITNNHASSKLYQKMIQSCKHFFIKNPIIIVPELSFNQRKRWHTQGSRDSLGRPKGRKICLSKLTSKIWITGPLEIWGTTFFLPEVTSFMPKIYQSDATSIHIYGTFSFNDFMVIASKCKILHLSSVVIINNDAVIPETEEGQFYFETAVSLEALFKALPNVKSFTYNLPYDSLNIITTKTAEELLKIPHFLSLNGFDISEVPEIFDIESFYGHIKVRF